MLCLGGRDPRVARNEVAPEENETRTTENRARVFVLPVFFERVPVLLPNAPPIVKQSKT